MAEGATSTPQQPKRVPSDHPEAQAGRAAGTLAAAAAGRLALPPPRPTGKFAEAVSAKEVATRRSGGGGPRVGIPEAVPRRHGRHIKRDGR